MSQCLDASTLILGEILRVELKLLKGPVGWMSLLTQLVKEAPRWETYLARVADLPDLPAPALQLLVNPTDGNKLDRPLRNWPRRLAIVAAVVLVVSGAGVVAWQFGALIRPTKPMEWLQLAGAVLGLSGFGGLVTWAVRKWLRSRLGL
jgi:hypothetical protein